MSGPRLSVTAAPTTLLEWEGKASHPWILRVEISYDSSDENGMPEDAMYDLLDRFEQDATAELTDCDGYLNVLRTTGNHSRVFYLACKDFRVPSKVLKGLSNKYSKKLNPTYEIHKDKYWRSFEQFRSRL